MTATPPPAGIDTAALRARIDSVESWWGLGEPPEDSPVLGLVADARALLDALEAAEADAQRLARVTGPEPDPALVQAVAEVLESHYGDEWPSLPAATDAVRAVGETLRGSG